jgi:sugar phosphate isomerase/epimerase
MRIGALNVLTMPQLDRMVALGLRSVGWMRFADSAAGPTHDDWRPFAEDIAAAARARDVRISAIGAFYRNPLDPRQTDTARAVLLRAIDVASHIGVRTVSAFAGGVVETDCNERGGNPVYRPLELGLDRVLAFWEPLAAVAAGKGVRIAFENCPQGAHHLPVMGYNLMARPAMWERFFDATRHENLGLEWDPSHLVCQFIDPVANLRQFAARVFHVHAKDAYVDRALLARYGPCHAGVTEHRFPGLGQSDWAQIVRELVRAGYDSDLNIEGHQDPVYRDHDRQAPSPLAGRQLEDDGLRIARETLERWVPRQSAPGRR